MFERISDLASHLLTDCQLQKYKSPVQKARRQKHSFPFNAKTRGWTFFIRPA